MITNYKMVDKTIADEVVRIAQRQLTVSAAFKQPRMLEILDNEAILNFKPRPALEGRLNVPFDSVFMSGYVDSLVSESNRPPRVEFEDPTGSNMKGAKKTNAAWQRDSKRMRLRMKNRGMKKMSAISGRGIAKYYAESDPKYCPYLQIVDYLDFHCEPQGGGHLDDHYFQGEENIFRSFEDLRTGAKSGWYDAQQVGLLVSKYLGGDLNKKSTEAFVNKNARYQSLGLDLETNNYVGGTLYNLVEWVTIYKGEKYHLIWDQPTGLWVRCVLLKDDFSLDKGPWISFATPMEDAFNFWNLGPADKAKPVFEAIRINLNEVLNNNRKRNWDMKAVDKEMFPDLKKLNWRQDGIVHANSNALRQSIKDGIYSFETPEITGALNLNIYLNNLAGEKLGGGPNTLGNSPSDKVGIYQGNMLQISKRTKLTTDSYEEMYEDLALRFDWGLYEHASEKDMVKLISTDGVGWEGLTKEDMDPDYVISVVSASEELVDTDEVKKMKIEAISTTEGNPLEMSMINVKVLLEEKFTILGFNEDKIKKLLDKSTDTTDELISEAKKAIEQILLGKKTKLNFSATTGYLQYISDWILDNSDDLKPEIKTQLEKYFDRHVPIAIKNAEQKRFNDDLLAKGNTLGTKTTTTPIGTNIPAPDNNQPPLNTVVPVPPVAPNPPLQ